MEYLSIDALVDLIEEPNGTRCHRMLEDNRELFERAKGSKTKHQAWDGGYLAHIEECGNIARQQYAWMERTERKLPFTLGDALLVLFLHDLEKPWKYGAGEHIPDPKRFVLEKVTDYRIELNPGHENALQYIHGADDAYDPIFRQMSPLAAFCHACDTMSARIWHYEPKQRGSW